MRLIIMGKTGCREKRTKRLFREFCVINAWPFRGRAAVCLKGNSYEPFLPYQEVVTT